MMISNCCGAYTTAEGVEFGICPDCREPCDFEDENEEEEEEVDSPECAKLRKSLVEWYDKEKMTIDGNYSHFLITVHPLQQSVSRRLNEFTSLRACLLIATEEELRSLDERRKLRYPE